MSSSAACLMAAVSWGKVGEQSRRDKNSWGILGTHLGHSRGKNYLKHSFGKLNILGAQLAPKVTWGTVEETNLPEAHLR